jgi:ATP-dependent metalloprotease FtsH
MASDSSKGDRKWRRGSLGLWCSLALIMLLAGYLALLEASRPHLSGDRLRYDELTRLIEARDIRDARVLNQDAYIVGTYRRGDGAERSYAAPYLKNAQIEDDLTSLLVRNRVPTTVDQQFSKSLVTPLTFLVPGVMLAFVFFYLLTGMRRGTGLFSTRSGARRIRGEQGGATFADVAGQDAAIAELRDVTEFLSAPERFRELGARHPKGVLLYGPPGCGKTLLARALAGETGASYYYISGSDFVEMYTGVGAARVRELFREARENVPAIVFIDELDSIGRHRAGGSAQAETGSGEEQEQALNQILTEMDGFSVTDEVILIGATNRPDVLDPALLRPGRFDRTVGLERPTEEGRFAILSLHAQSTRLDPDVDLRDIANRAIGLTGADLANVINEAALLAGRARKATISKDELERGLERILEAPERQRRLSMRNRSVGRRASGTEGRVTFADLAGVDDAIEELEDIRDYLATPARFEKLGARAPRGILLAGPPGCGKTLLARAVAGEANAAFFQTAATEFVEDLQGRGAARVRDLFAEAKGTAPAIVFIDEIDAVGARRGASADSSESENTLNQFLVELDGFEQGSGMIVMAATNRPDILDPALMRAGRFDRQITIDLPDRDGRRAILAIHSGSTPLAADVDLDAVASATAGFSGADLATVMNEAGLLAARQGLEELTAQVLDDAVARAVLGISSRRRAMSDDERRMTAYHEAGHALVGQTLPGVTLPHKLSIIPHGNTLGFVWQTDGNERSIESRSMLLNQMAMGLAGRAAEELVFGESGSGAGPDLREVNAVARRMVCELGMSEALGGMSFSRSGEGLPGEELALRYSEKEAQLVGEEVRRLVDEANRRALEVLRGSRGPLDRLAELLLERETLSGPELERILDEPLVPSR